MDAETLDRANRIRDDLKELYAIIPGVHCATWEAVARYFNSRAVPVSWKVAVIDNVRNLVRKQIDDLEKELDEL